ncbi:cell wall hydrolase [Effusibacillus consociatus]|uniref:Cell wall hydrolase n=1 Tax=Effusibacillus consociatus TaxID=1117041 RepID=A0ABV9Q6X4_9BACL
MRENTSAMTLVMTVLIALTITLNPVLTPSQASVQRERVILSLPWKETSSTVNMAASVTEQPASENVKETEEKAQEDIQSAEILASRSGQAPARKAEPPKPSYSQEDLFWLAKEISSEAKGESLEGQIAVGAVVLNRVNDPRFPKTIKDVIFAKGQFDPVRYGTIEQEPVPSAMEAAKRVLEGENPVPGALYFYNPTIATDQWIRTLRVIKRIGNHVFAAR